MCAVAGVELMKKYQEEVAELEAQRQELTNAEKLFELPITMYPELLKVQKEVKGLEQIYEIYTEQKVSKCAVTGDVQNVINS